MIFSGNADFSHATFKRNADFRQVLFSEAVKFEDVRFGATDQLVSPLADFRDVSILKPELVRFLRTNAQSKLGLRARFVNCRVEGVQFDAVRWYRSQDRMMLQDEEDILEQAQDAPSYEEVATAYRRLITNFEKSRAYDLSEDCTIGEFEMKRRNPDRFLFAEWLKPVYESFPRLRTCIGEQVSIVGIYRLASLYGTSYQRALGVLVFLLLVFGLCFSTIGDICPKLTPGKTAAADIQTRVRSARQRVVAFF